MRCFFFKDTYKLDIAMDVDANMNVEAEKVDDVARLQALPHLLVLKAVTWL